MVASGLATKDIAFRLNVSYKTAATHRELGMAKIGAHNAADVTRYVLSDGCARKEMI